MTGQWYSIKHDTCACPFFVSSLQKQPSEYSL